MQPRDVPTLSANGVWAADLTRSAKPGLTQKRDEDEERRENTKRLTLRVREGNHVGGSCGVDPVTQSSRGSDLLPWPLARAEAPQAATKAKLAVCDDTTSGATHARTDVSYQRSSMCADVQSCLCSSSLYCFMSFIWQLKSMLITLLQNSL